MAVAELPVLMTEAEFCELTGIRPQTATNWRCRRVGPPFIRLGNRTVRYDRAEVLEWLKDSRVKTSGEQN
ncbi:MAG TPA: helix-turn-helix domain-containing protein [Tepidisphaeraceae bacterium]|jgi:predicted DNA-binding transcriptional regulator AlpA